MSEIIVCSLLRGAWQVVISPADHIPSHYTEMLGISYAFDFAKKDPEDLATTSFLETIHLYGHKLRWEDSPSFVYIQLDLLEVNKWPERKNTTIAMTPSRQPGMGVTIFATEDQGRL
ncbi:MAG: hypothetical protein L3J88_04940 [Gammaproteobacteria bacterium]|nr:hypothetical protein [Gammaproteobacteria bacterium]